MVNIELKNVDKSFRDVRALDNVNLFIKDKEYFIILGPTGAGKTTLLKVIAGLVKQDNGTVLFDDQDVSELTPAERNLGFMFENYALFPHMNIYDNIAYSSRVHARNPKQTKKIVDQVLMMTLLTGRNESLPEEMSGGMKQRVALCRALMNLEQSKLLILDEPLKALDAGLRMSLRRELLLMAKSSQLQLTVIHITNEEEEAMMLADRIAVMNEGKIIQVGTPYEIYYQPRNLFVANFMSEINYFEGKFIQESLDIWDIHKKSNKEDKLFSEIQEKSIAIPIDIGASSIFAGYVNKNNNKEMRQNEDLLLIVRSNHMKIRLGNRLDQKKNALLGTIIRRKFMGVFYRFEVLVNINKSDKNIIVTIPASTEIHNKFREGIEVTVYFPKELGIIFKHPGMGVIREVLKLE
jgi:ABC-type Fe3+/spermidine/putrescine transport system ATPase subunit